MNWLIRIIQALTGRSKLLAAPIRDLEGLTGRVLIYDTDSQNDGLVEADIVQRLILRGARILPVVSRETAFRDGVSDLERLLKDADFVLLGRTMEVRSGFARHIIIGTIKADIRLDFQCIERGGAVLAQGQVQTDLLDGGRYGSYHDIDKDLPYILRKQMKDMGQVVIRQLDSTSVWSRIHIG